MKCEKQRFYPTESDSLLPRTKFHETGLEVASGRADDGQDGKTNNYGFLRCGTILSERSRGRLLLIATGYILFVVMASMTQPSPLSNSSSPNRLSSIRTFSVTEMVNIVVQGKSSTTTTNDEGDDDDDEDWTQPQNKQEREEQTKADNRYDWQKCKQASDPNCWEEEGERVRAFWENSGTKIKTFWSNFGQRTHNLFHSKRSNSSD